MKGLIGKVKFEYGNKDFSFDVDKEISYGPDTINEDIVDQASKFAWAGILHAKARRIASDEKMNHEVLCAKLYSKHRLQLEKDSDKKTTEKQIESEVIQDKKYADSFAMLSDAKENEMVLKGLVDALAHRKDMIQSLASNIRQDREHGFINKSKEVDKKYGGKKNKR